MKQGHKLLFETAYIGTFYTRYLCILKMLYSTLDKFSNVCTLIVRENKSTLTCVNKFTLRDGDEFFIIPIDKNLEMFCSRL